MQWLKYFENVTTFGNIKKSGELGKVGLIKKWLAELMLD